MPELPPSAGTKSPTGKSPAAGDRPEPEIVNRKPAFLRLWAYRRLWLVGILVFVLDQLTKHWIRTGLPFGSYGPMGRPVIPGFFNLVHVGNTGAAWSMFAGRSLMLAGLAGATLLFIHLFRRQLGLRHAFAQMAFGLLCGGIVGNLVDRIVHGHVIDFIDLHFGGYIYPTFNVADSAICIGVFAYILWSLKQPAYGENAKSQMPNPR